MSLLTRLDRLEKELIPSGLKVYRWNLVCELGENHDRTVEILEELLRTSNSSDLSDVRLSDSDVSKPRYPLPK